MTTTPQTNLKVVDGAPEPKMTVGELAAFEFKGVREFKGLSEKQRKRRAWIKADHIYRMAQLALTIVAMEKEELVTCVRKNYDTMAPALADFTQAGICAETIREIIISAEMRLAVALAVIDGDEPNDPPPGEYNDEEAAA